MAVVSISKAYSARNTRPSRGRQGWNGYDLPAKSAIMTQPSKTEVVNVGRSEIHHL